MYSVDDMRIYANRLGFKEAYMAEKDYLQELLLRAIFSKIPESRLVFRGGTALAKIYGSGRFSDDLDFVANVDKEPEVLFREIEAAINSINGLYETTFSGPEKYKDMVGYEIKINGPLFITSQHEASRQTLSIDINTYERLNLAPINLIRVPIYPDIPPYSLTVEQIEELLMDKVAALMERKRISARDLYDIWIILKKNSANMDKSKIKKVYDIYSERRGRIDYSLLVSRIDKVAAVWKNEIGSLVNIEIPFEVVATEVKQSLKEILSF